MPKKRTKTRRNQKKYPALEQEFNLRTRTDLIDYDYINQLTDEEKDWLNRFTEEYSIANFRHKGDRIHPLEPFKKIVDGEEIIKNEDKYRKESFDRNNARNRCIYTKSKAGNKLVHMDDITRGDSSMKGFHDSDDSDDQSDQ